MKNFDILMKNRLRLTKCIRPHDTSVTPHPEQLRVITNGDFITIAEAENPIKPSNTLIGLKMQTVDHITYYYLVEKEPEDLPKGMGFGKFFPAQGLAAILDTPCQNGRKTMFVFGTDDKDNVGERNGWNFDAEEII